MSRLILIRQGRESPTKRFSQAKPTAEPSLVAEIQTSFKPTVDARQRANIRSDPTKCLQFVCVWNDTIGFLTRPEITTTTDGNIIVVGSFSDSIGTAIPVSLPVEDFDGCFTTLVSRADANRFNFAQFPTSPDVLPGPPAPNPEAEGDDHEPLLLTEGTRARLNFPIIDGDEEDTQPVIVALPSYPPLTAGQTFPEGFDFNTNTPTGVPILDAWLGGLRYAKTNNTALSVTLGGPLFHLPSMAIPGNPIPFGTLSIRPTLPPNPTMLLPQDALYARVRCVIENLSDEFWADLGSTIPPTPSTQPTTNSSSPLTAESIRAIVEPFATTRAISRKELDQTAAAKEVAYIYQLALAAVPDTTEPTPPGMHIPDLHPEFLSALNKSKPVAAAQVLQELMATNLEVASASDKGLDRDVTFDVAQCTTAFANAIRSGHWLVDPLPQTPKTIAQQKLCLIHFLPPVRGTLLASRQREAAQDPLILSHISDDRAQLEASKSSSLYSHGRLESGKDVHLAACNLRLNLLSMISPDSRTPLLIEKLLAYTDLLTSRPGRLWLETHRLDRNIPTHVFQDAQHILQTFFALAKSTRLRVGLRESRPIEPKNYWNAARTSDALIDRLRGIISGNGLGPFESTPYCLSWFPYFTPKPNRRLDVPRHEEPRHPTASRTYDRSPSGDPRRQDPRRRPDLTPTHDATQKKSRTRDTVEVDKCKKQGLLVYDPKTGGERRLPTCPVYEKATPHASPERLCMQFLTRGYYCSRGPCPFPHITNLKHFTGSKAKDFTAFVEKTPGLSFAEGRGPAGTK